jgi:hypothetical protein
MQGLTAQAKQRLSLLLTTLRAEKATKNADGQQKMLKNSILGDIK